MKTFGIAFLDFDNTLTPNNCLSDEDYEKEIEILVQNLTHLAEQKN